MPAAANDLLGPFQHKPYAPQLSGFGVPPRTVVITRDKRADDLQALFSHTPTENSSDDTLEVSEKSSPDQEMASTEDCEQLATPRDTQTSSQDDSATTNGRARPVASSPAADKPSRCQGKKGVKHEVVSEKACGRCGVVKSAMHYHLNRSKPTGLGSWCKECTVLWYKTKPRHEPQVATKKCTGCGTVKPADKFHRQSRLPTGLRIYCKDCEHDRYSKKTKVEVPTVVEKRCTKCQAVKPAVEFHKQRNVSTGLHSWCKSCVAADYAQHPRRKRTILPDTKLCEACGVDKPALAFRRDRGTPDGLHVWCKHCNDSRVGRTPNRFQQGQQLSSTSGTAASGGGLTSATGTTASPSASPPESLLRRSYESICTRPDTLPSGFAPFAPSALSTDGLPWTSALDHAPASAFTRCLPSAPQPALDAFRTPAHQASTPLALPAAHAHAPSHTHPTLGVPLGMAPSQLLLSKHGLPSAFASAMPGPPVASAPPIRHAALGLDPHVLGTTTLGLPVDLPAALDVINAELDDGAWAAYGALAAQGRVCAMCSKLRPVSHFYSDSNSADGSGLVPWCTPCVQAALGGPGAR